MESPKPRAAGALGADRRGAEPERTPGGFSPPQRADSYPAVAASTPTDPLAATLARSVQVRTVAERANGPTLQRVIYKDQTAKVQHRPYKDLNANPWYEDLPLHERRFAIALHKSRREHLTLAEATAEIAAIMANTRVAPTADDGFDDHVIHAHVAAQDRILTPLDFEALPPEGTINPFRLRTAQGGIELTFSDKVSKVHDLVRDLIADPAYASNLPPVSIGCHADRVWSFDTRRVVACQMARAKNPAVEVRYKKISPEYLEERIATIFTPRPWMGIVTAVRDVGKKGGSEPWVNPAYEAQLGDMPWERDDFEGFPWDRQAPLPAGPAVPVPLAVPTARTTERAAQYKPPPKSDGGSAKARAILEQRKEEEEKKKKKGPGGKGPAKKPGRGAGQKKTKAPVKASK